jgi:demethylmenaquinone methyltransferase/2-methoxy-6-polyprenyl-1,4-benzoquinol methylase
MTDNHVACPPLPAYAAEAVLYEQRTSAFDTWRRQLIDLLPLDRGNVVLDVGCGTGLCLPLLRERVGPAGMVVGIDASAEMLAVARRHVEVNGWNNVVLVQSPIEDAELPVLADAAVLCAVHDVLRSETALANVADHVVPGGWVTAVGGKWAPAWMPTLNVLAYQLHRPYVRSFEGFERPWSVLEGFVDSLRVTEVAWGSGYLALGRKAAEPPGGGSSG